MSEFFEVPDESEDTPEDSAPETTFEPDPATVAFLDQEAAAFKEIEDEFEQMYGFHHACQCDEDYAKGRVGEVTECYAGMIVDSLATCARLNHENSALKEMLNTMMTMNNELIDNLADGNETVEAHKVTALDVPVQIEVIDESDGQ